MCASRPGPPSLDVGGELRKGIEETDLRGVLRVAAECLPQARPEKAAGRDAMMRWWAIEDQSAAFG
jgi:hypothetical protein